MRFTDTLTTLLGLSHLGVSRSLSPDSVDHARSAQIRNFAPVDILDGNDGLEPHPASPLSYGRPVLHVDSTGNAIEEHNARLFYLDDGKYYMLAESWACGRMVFFKPPVPGYPINDTFPPGDYGGNCGITVHTSTDLTNWDFETLIEPRGIPGVPTKPRLVYSAVTQKYVLWLKSGDELGFTGGLFYLTADTPLGPWSEASVASGDHLAHDFDMEMDDNGDYYIVTDAFRGVYDPLVPGKPLWDVVLQKLLPDCTGVVGTNESKVQIMQSADFQGIGLSSHNGRWYITGGPTCSNCEVPIQYISAPSPTGPWSTEDGTMSPDIKEGTVIAERGCGGQNKGLNKLPTADGGSVVVAAIWGYRSSPSNYAVGGRLAHADNQQSISSTYWYPLEFDEDGRVKEFTCAASVDIPLATEARPRSWLPSVPYQPDCRVRRNSSFTQTGLKFAREQHSQPVLRVPVFQRTDDLGPKAQDGPVMEAPLNVDLAYTNKESVTFSFAPSNISWAPQIIELPIESGSGEVVSVTLRTESDNGCYGVLAEPRRDNGGGRYFVSRGGDEEEVPMAQLYVP